jgi:hypothetical protein
MRGQRAQQAYMTRIALARFSESTFFDAACGKLVFGPQRVIVLSDLQGDGVRLLNRPAG